jgi:pyruvate formate lyase activating enzyme
LELSGQEVTVAQVMKEVLADRAFYENSGGGVTLSGGEPLMQPEFAKEILARSKAEGIHTAIETAGYYRWDRLADLLPLIDLVMMDLKHIDADAHREATGVDNDLILANARRLAATEKPIIFRTPVIPTVNDTPEVIGAIAQFVHSLASTAGADSDNGQHANSPDTVRFSLELLPFHRLATDKYRNLGMAYRASQLEPPSKEHMAALVEAARVHGIPVHSR